MIIPLVRVPRCRGSYDIDGDGKPQEMPLRALWLAPDAAESFSRDLADHVVVSDMFRGPDSSLAAKRAGRGAAAPGYSAHNYGRAIDINIRETMRELGLGTKAELDTWMDAHGWRCWRRDHAMASEAWHYYWTTGVEWRGVPMLEWQAACERDFPAVGATGRHDAYARQSALSVLGYYSGECDGKWGPLSRAAAHAFERAWGPNTDRTLFYVAWHRRYLGEIRNPRATRID